MNLLGIIPRKWLPRNAWGDKEYRRRRYIGRHERLPNPVGPERINDYLNEVKMDGSLPEPSCQFVTNEEFAKFYVTERRNGRYSCRRVEAERRMRDRCAA